MQKEWSDKLEIGSGGNPGEGFTHLDINPNAPHVEFIGDIRAIFMPEEFDINLYPTLLPLKAKSQEDELLLFKEIRLYHVVEHIHWYNQMAMWQWLYQLLKEGGKLDIETPDMEWVMKLYLKNRSKWRRFLNGGIFNYPRNEHPDISANTGESLSRWVAFKIHSGGSYDKPSGIYDHHLGMYDKTRLKAELENSGFSSTVSQIQGTLKAIAVKQIKKS
ncbi:MAG TPA: hypothetical protein QF468_00240 [Nitrospinota bacterium]|jgi:hypothetical protein|nr:hypothetical protein [Nitrospinota bacterium]